MADLLAGAARLSLEPPLDLPLVGFVRQTHDATGYGRFGLETSAIALERDGVRVVLCGVDIVGIGEPEITRLLDRIADATGADPAGILLNWNHTHLSVIGGFWGGELTGPPEPERDARIRSFADVVQDKVVSVCRLAFERLEPARPVWGVGYAELAVNRRERAADGTTILGWNPDNLVDNQVTSLQLRRPDESVDRDRGQLRLPPGHDGLRHVRLLRRLPGAATGCRAAQHRRRGRLPPGCRGQRPAEGLVHG